MDARFLRLVIFLLGVAVLFSWVSGVFDSAVPPSTSIDQGSNIAAPALGHAEAPPADGLDSEEDLIREDFARIVPTTDGENSAPKELPSTSFVLHVVHGKTGAAIPHAPVFEVRDSEEFHLQNLAHRARYSDWKGADPELLIRHQADQHGNLTLRVRENRSTITFFAAIENLYGATYFQMSPGKEHTLKLWPDQTWTALTIDSSGKPLTAIPVAIQKTIVSRGSKWFAIRSISNSNGIARLPHVQSLTRYTKSGDIVKVLPMVPLLEDLGVTVDLASPPPQPIVFELPQMGRLEIELLDEHGEILASDFDLHLAIDSNPISGRSQDELFAACSQPGLVTFRSPGQRGKTSFPYVGLGLNFVVDLYSKQHGSIYGFGRGPAHPGETAVIQVQKPAPSGFQMRLVDEHKQPLPFASWTMSVNMEHDGHGRGTGESGKTNALGITFLEMEPDWLDALQTATEAKAELTVFSHNPAALWKATFPLPTGSAAQSNTLGDVVVLEKDAVEIHGTVLDEQGGPVKGAFFSLQEFIFEDGTQHWSTIDVAVTDDSGAFHYFERKPQGDARYGVSKRGFLMLTADGIPESDARFTLSRGLQIEGKIQLPAWLQGTRMNLFVSNANRKSRHFARNFNNKTGSFKIEGLEATPFGLSLLSQTHGIILGNMESVFPWESGAAPDSRLVNWILSPTPQEYFFSVTDLTGAVIANAQAYFLGDSFGTRVRNGKVPAGIPVPLPVSTAQAKFTAAGFRSLTVEVHAGENAIVLQKGFPVKLLLNPPPPLQPGMRIACEVYTGRPSKREWSTVVNSWQDLRFPCSEAREYSVRIATVPKGKEPWAETSTVLVEQTFIVQEQDTEQVILLELKAP
jgi:hypothetical protein